MTPIESINDLMFSNLKSNTGHQIIVRAKFAEPTSAKLFLQIKFLFLLSPPYA